VRGWPLGPFETNCYVVCGAGTDACWIIDPGLDPSEVIEAILAEHLRPEAIVLTHAHLDHVAGIPAVLRAFPGVEILGHAAEREWPQSPMLNLSESYGIPIAVPGATRFIGEGDSLTLGEDTWRVLHTPGHSPGGLTFVNDAARVAIVGDTLFAGSIGRSDFPGSDEQQLHRSIREKLYTLADETRVLPGHGPVTTIGREKRSNPYVRP
jgi:glyoxylase-like metal-dependent hydrolase (beta-lactamase superfamily II)